MWRLGVLVCNSPTPAFAIDRISITENSATTHGYPLYDGHGNCRAILTRDGTDDYATGNWRTYDVWGSVRSGSATGDPKSRYVASIGHVVDDESSLIYMRARYYEPATGRFISEDSAMHGRNWYVYCSSDPINRRDADGNQDFLDPLHATESLLVEVLATLVGTTVAARIVRKVFSMTTKQVYTWMFATSETFLRRGMTLVGYGAEMVAAARANGWLSAGAIAGAKLIAKGIVLIAAGWLLRIVRYMMFLE